MVDIVTRLGKGSPLTNAEVDANFTNLAEVSGVTGEPMGHEDRTTSTISFNASTRTFTITPVASSFTVWCKGKKVVVSTAQTVTIPNTTGMYSIYYDANGVLSAKSGYFTFSLEAPTAYVYWNAATGTAPYFGDERHGVVLDWQTHEYLHRTRGAALASGFSASGYVLGGNGSSNSHAQITLEGGTFFDEDMKIIVTATNTPTAGTWEQDLLSPARIPVLYLSGTGWVIDAPTDYPLKQGTARPQYNAYSGGVWSTADVANNKYATSWILATNNLTYPVIAIIGQAENDLQSAAEAVDFTALQLPGFPSVEFRPLYKLIFQCADSCTNAVHASLVSITDIRSIAAAGTAASIVTDHGNLSGLSDDDHPQYIHVDTLRTVSAAVKASFLPSQTSNAGKFLQTDGTATLWQALTSGNVTTALGFTPYNATNPSGYISGITSEMVTTAIGFTPYNATNPSGYVTAAGARGAISVTGAGSYDSATGVINIVGGVTSFNTRTGAITLSSADVTTALGFTPYNNTNPSGYITGITSTMVTTALGYTPYNSSNPNGYISSITSANVTTALGFTPYNATNPSGYITSSALSGYLTSASAASTYLPLAGGTLSGAFTVNNAFSTFSKNAASGANEVAKFINSGGGYSSRIYIGANPGADWLIGKDCYGAGNDRFQIGSWNGYAYIDIAYNTTAGTINFPNNGGLTVNSNTILHAGNYSSYALPLSGGTLTGPTYINTGGNYPLQLISTQRYMLQIRNSNNSVNSGYGWWFATDTNFNFAMHADGLGDVLTLTRSGALTLNGNTVLHAGNYSSYALPLSGGTLTGKLTITPAAGLDLYRLTFDADGTDSWYRAGSGNRHRFTTTGGADFIIGNASGVATLNGNQVLHAGNYNSYAPTLTGGGASGTWSINVTGNAGSATTAAKSSATTVPASTAFTKWLFATNSTSGTQDWNHVSNTRPGVGEVLLLGNHANGPGGGNYYHPLNFEYSSIEGSGNVTQLAIAYGSPGNELYMRGSYSGSWNGWNRFLNSNNYSSYALPLSGGTLSGDLRVNTIRDTAGGWVLGKYGTEVSLGSAGLVNEIRFNSSANAAFEYRGNAILHAGNYSSYALPISGGSLTGALSAVSGLRSYYSDHIAGDGYGIRFWESNAYKISMGASSLYQYGTVTDYSIKMQMDNGSPGRGFTWGRESYAPIASLNATSGNFQTAGQMYVQGAQIASGAFTVRAGGASGVGWGTGLNIGDSSNYSGFIQDAGISRWRNTGSGGYDWFNSATTQIMALSNSGYLGVGQASDASYRIIASGHIYANANGNVYAEGRHYSRHGTGTFYESLTTGNYSSYALPLSGGSLSGSLTINNSSPTIYLQDTDNRSAMIHVNSNTFYVLRGSGTNSGSWSTYNGYWPLELNLENNNATFGGSISSVGNTVLHAGNFSSYSHSIATSDSRYSRKDTTSQWIKPYYEYGSYLTSESPATLKDQMGGGGLRVDFMNPSYTGSGGWNHVITWSGYNMYNMYQLGGHYDGGTGTDLWVRSEANHGGTSWTAWRKLLNSSNYNSYSPTLTGGNASGTWGINISGRGYPRRSDGNDLNFYWSGQSGQPTWLWGGSDGANMYVYNPSNFSVARAQRANGNFYIDDNYGNGVVGVYSSYRYQGVFAMGDSYKLPADGTTTGSLYGMAWSHPNAGGAAGNLSDHGLLIINNGVFRCAISNSIVAASNITAYSDERLKTNWRDMPENFVARLAQVKVGIYDRTDEEDVTQVGVSAQSFQKLLPQAIMKAKDEMGTLSVSYGNAALASAVELAKDNVELRARIERLESLINKLIGD